MATSIEQAPSQIESEVIIPTAERSTVASPIGWASIFAAAAVSLGVWIVLHLFGLGVGLAALDPDHPNSLRGAGIGIGVWSLIAPLIALFVGGMVAGRVAPTINTLNAAIHGAVTWAIAMIVGLAGVIMLLGSLAHGVAAAGGAVASQAGNLGAQASDVSSAVGLTGDDLVGPINQRLKARGLPAVKADDLQEAAKEAMRTSVRTGKVDRQQLVDTLAKRTSLSRTDAEQVATEMETQLDQMKNKGSDLAQSAEHTALSAGDTTGKMLLLLTLMMVLALIASVGGAIVSVRRERLVHVRMPRGVNR